MKLYDIHQVDHIRVDIIGDIDKITSTVRVEIFILVGLQLK